jgi:hypothetical protein
MASREVRAREWICDVCGRVDRVEATTLDLPPGWSTAAGQIISGQAEHTRKIDLCPACAADTDAAVARFNAQVGG